MTSPMTRGLSAAALAACLLVSATAFAEDSGSPLSALGRMFGQKPQAAETTGQQETPTTDQVLRIERLETQLRQMTGSVEQLQYRNQQLENQIRSMGGTPVTQATPAQPHPPVQAALPPAPAPMAAPLPAPAPAPSMPAPGRRADVFDPSQNPNAPGAPRPLGGPQHEPPPIIAAEPPLGAPGGRNAGAPLDLSNLSSANPGAPPQSGPLPAPPSRNLSATGAVAAVAPPSNSPKDAYDLAYGYVLHKDYALAEESFRAYLQKFPNDKRAADARFWIGESLFQRQRYEQAAQAFLDLSTKHGSYPKAPEALLRLAQSLDAMKQKEMACATLAEVGRKYPKAPLSVKNGVEREQKRARC